jgi:hypothetical protein
MALACPNALPQAPLVCTAAKEAVTLLAEVTLVSTQVGPEQSPLKVLKV